MTEQTTTQAAPERIEPERFAELATRDRGRSRPVHRRPAQLVRQTLISLLAGGHALLEGVPGLGKTMLVRTAGRGARSRLQPHPVHARPDAGRHRRHQHHRRGGGRAPVPLPAGPIFANLVLADEINRATPKTQSALLEAMQEHRVTVAKQQYTLSEPFFVLATQNPLEMEGTYPLPEAQLDRFFFKVDVPFPSADELIEIMDRTTGAERDRRSSRPRPAPTSGDAGAGARRADRQPRDGLRGAGPARHATRTAKRLPSWSPSTCATAARRAACRRSCWPPRSTPCSMAASTWPSATSGGGAAGAAPPDHPQLRGRGGGDQHGLGGPRDPGRDAHRSGRVAGCLPDR